MSKIEKVKSALMAMQSYSWEQGAAAHAFMELGETEVVIQMAKAAVLRQGEDGRLGILGPDVGVTDPAAIGEAVLYAARVTNEPKLKQAADKMLNYLLHEAPKTKDGILYHLTDKPQVWIDAMYMAPPFLAIAGCSDESIKQIEGFRKLLWNPEKKLYSHAWDDATKSFLIKDCWGVGNGWAAAGLARVIRALPAEMMSQKSQLISYAKEVIDGCLGHQREDGLFHNVVDNPETFVETNLAQMLAYSIYSGVKEGWLDASYCEAAERMREAVTEKVDEYGLVQGVCGAPTFDYPGTAPEGQAFFILMEAAAEKAGQ